MLLMNLFYFQDDRSLGNQQYQSHLIHQQKTYRASIHQDLKHRHLRTRLVIDPLGLSLLEKTTDYYQVPVVFDIDQTQQMIHLVTDRQMNQ